MRDCEVRLLLEVEEVGEVADGGTVDGDVGVGVLLLGVGEIVAAVAGERLQLPVVLDEFEDGDVVRVLVRNVAGFGEGRDDEQWDAGSVAEEVDGLNVAGVVVAAAFVEGDEDGGVGPDLRIGLDHVDDLLGEAFEEVELGGGGVTVDETAGLDEGDCGEGVVLDVGVEVGGVLDMCGDQGGVGHDVAGVLEEVADVAVNVGGVLVVRVVLIDVPLIAVVLEGDVFLLQSISDGAQFGWRHGKDGVLGVGVGIGVGAVAEVAGVVVVEQIIVAGLAVRFDVVGQRTEIAENGGDARGVAVGAIAIAAAA